MKWRVWIISKGRQRTLRRRRKKLKKLMPYKTRVTVRLGIEGQRDRRGSVKGREQIGAYQNHGLNN